MSSIYLYEVCNAVFYPTTRRLMMIQVVKIDSMLFFIDMIKSLNSPREHARAWSSASIVTPNVLSTATFLGVSKALIHDRGLSQ